MLKDVEVIEGRQATWFDTYGRSEAVDVAAAAELKKVKEEHTRGGFVLLTEAALEAFEDDWRRKRDLEATLEGGKIEMDRAILAQRIDDEIRDQERLKAPQETLGVTTEKYLLASILDELQTTSALRDLQGLTRLELSDLVATWKDDRDSAKVRAVESALASGALARLGLRDDPETDAIGVSRLQTVIAARRRARVSDELTTAAERLRTLSRNMMFDVTLRHLKSGKGIAVRPKPMVLA